MAATRERVLDVGNCDPDHAMIRTMLERNFDVEIDRVMFVEEALAAMRATRYRLVLVNRLIFADNSEGMELLRQAKGEAAIADQPIMIISNYPEAQAASEAAGGVRGFGKSGVGSAATFELLGSFLSHKRS